MRARSLCPARRHRKLGGGLRNCAPGAAAHRRNGRLYRERGPRVRAQQQRACTIHGGQLCERPRAPPSDPLTYGSRAPTAAAAAVYASECVSPCFCVAWLSPRCAGPDRVLHLRFGPPHCARRRRPLHLRRCAPTQAPPRMWASLRAVRRSSFSALQQPEHRQMSVCSRGYSRGQVLSCPRPMRTSGFPAPETRTARSAASRRWGRTTAWRTLQSRSIRGSTQRRWLRSSWG